MYVRNMVHHWRASDNLEHSFRPGEWRLYDRGTLIGIIEYGRINHRAGLRGLTPERRLLGYAWTLEEACDRMWEWYRASALGHTTAAEDQPEDRADDRQEERDQNPDELAEAAVIRVVHDRHHSDDEDDEADDAAADGDRVHVLPFA